LLRQTVQRVDRVKGLVEQDQVGSLVHMALRFCLSHPAVTTVIPGVRTAEQVMCNLAAGDQGPLSQTLIHQIARLWQNEFHQNVRTSIGAEGEG
jgi:aryl-alcohol dehydrogenase-like predicted oxidoreductase